MKPNMLPIERGIRSLTGMLLLASPLLDLRTYPYNLLGIVLIATGVSGVCLIKAAVKKLLPPDSGRPTRSTAAPV